MEQLIEITRVPIEIEMKTSRAHLEYAKGTAELEISRDKGGMSIKSRPIQLNMDTFEMRSSIMPTPTQTVQQTAQKGKEAAYTATASFAQEGELYLKAQIGEDVQKQLAQTVISTHMFSQPGLDFIPKAGPEITWDPGEISVKQKPEVIIKYIGGPLYVPPSADPNYEPLDVQA